MASTSDFSPRRVTSIIHARLKALGVDGKRWLSQAHPHLAGVRDVRWVECDQGPDLYVIIGSAHIVKNFVRRRRALSDTSPMIALNLTDEEGANARILDAGADDCLTDGPGGLCELRARMQAVARRAGGALAVDSEIAADPQTLRIRVRHVEARVSYRLFQIFVFLAERRERWVHSSEIVSRICGTHHDPTTSLVRIQIYSLRKALREASSCIRSNGHGSYMLGVATSNAKHSSH